MCSSPPGCQVARLQGWLLTVERVVIFPRSVSCPSRAGFSVDVACVYFLATCRVFGRAVRLRTLIWPVSQIDFPLLKRMLRFSLR